MHALSSEVPDPAQARAIAEARPHQNDVVSVVQGSHATPGKILKGAEMRATITRPLIFKAAANLANGGYNTSILQIERRGDQLAICGTNTYVAVIGKVDADFSRWPDGEQIRFNGGEVQAIMRGIGKALKNATSLTIEIAKGYATFGLFVRETEVLVKIDYDKTEAGKPIQDFDKLGNWKEYEEGEPHVASHFMTLAANAMRTISPHKHTSWECKQHGKTSALEYVATSEPARVIVMPTLR